MSQDNKPAVVSSTTVYGNKSLTLTEMRGIATLFAQSGYWKDAKQAAQAFVKIAAGQEFGIMPFAAMTDIHVIEGKPTLGGHLIADRVKASPKYDFEIEKHTNEICSINFYDKTGAKKKLLGNSTFTIQDAESANLSNRGNWKSYARNMLFNRAISNGYRWFTPDVFSAVVYTPDEMGARVDDTGNYIAPPEEQPKIEAPKKPEPEEGQTEDAPEVTDEELENVDQAIEEAATDDAPAEPVEEVAAEEVPVTQPENAPEETTVIEKETKPEDQAAVVEGKLKIIVQQLRGLEIEDKDDMSLLIRYWSNNAPDPRQVEPYQLDTIIDLLKTMPKKFVQEALVLAKKKAADEAPAESEAGSEA